MTTIDDCKLLLCSYNCSRELFDSIADASLMPAPSGKLLSLKSNDLSDEIFYKASNTFIPLF